MSALAPAARRVAQAITPAEPQSQRSASPAADTAPATGLPRYLSRLPDLSATTATGAATASMATAAANAATAEATAASGETTAATEATPQTEPGNAPEGAAAETLEAPERGLGTDEQAVERREEKLTEVEDDTGEIGEEPQSGEEYKRVPPDETRPEPLPPPPPPPEMAGIHPRSIPQPPPMDDSRIRDIVARTGMKPAAHHEAVRGRLQTIAERATSLQAQIVREAQLASFDAMATFRTQADSVPAATAAAEELVRSAYASARVEVDTAASGALKQLEAHKQECQTRLDASSLTMQQQIQRVLASSSPAIQQVHAEQMADVDRALTESAANYRRQLGAKEEAIRRSTPRAVTTQADTPLILATRREAEIQYWPIRARQMADEVHQSIEGNARQILAQRDIFRISILRLVNPAAVQEERVANDQQGQLRNARMRTVTRVATDYERAVNTVTQFHKRALRQLDTGERATLKELRAIGRRLKKDVKARADNLEFSIAETARDLAQAYRIQMAGINESLGEEDFFDARRLGPHLDSAERRFEQMYAQQSASLNATITGAVAQIDEEILQQSQGASEMADESASGASRIARECVEAIEGAAQSLERALTAPVEGGVGAASPFAATASEALGARPAQVRTAVAEMIRSTKKTLDQALKQETDRLQGVVTNLDTNIGSSVSADGRAKIADLGQRAGKAYNAMVGVGTKEAELMAALRNLTFIQGLALQEIWHATIDPRESLVSWLLGDLSGDELRAALAYLSGNTTAGAQWEIESSLHWYGDDAGRVEDVLKSLLDEPPEGGHIGQIRGTQAWQAISDRLQGSLRGANLDVANALLVGNRYRADAVRLREHIEAARREGNDDKLHELLEQVPAEDLARVRRECLAIERGLGPDIHAADRISDEEARTSFLTFVTHDRQVWIQSGPHGEMKQVTRSLTGANRELAVALASRSLDERGGETIDSRVSVRAARMQVEVARGRRPNLTNLQRAFEFDEASELDEQLQSPYEQVRRRATERRDEERRVRMLALQRFAQQHGGIRGATQEQAREYAAGVVTRMFTSEEGRIVGRTMVEKGFADPAAAIRLAVEGAGTDEDLIRRTLRRLDRDQIADLRRTYQDRYHENMDRRLGTNPPPESQALTSMAFAISPLLGVGVMFATGGELSGDERLEADLLLLGRPRNDRERTELEQARTQQQRTETGPVGRAWMSLTGSNDERLMNQANQRLMRITGPQAFDANGRFVGAHPTYNDKAHVWEPDPQEAWAFREALRWNQFGAEAYQAGIDRLTNYVSTAIALVAAVVVTIAVPGIGGAIAGAIIGGLLSMASKAALKGGRYGWEEAAVDLAVTAVDAATAGLTHGMGEAMRTVGLAAEEASFGARRTAGMLAGLAGRGRAGKAAAYAITEGLENFAGSVPSSLLGQTLNEQNWKAGSPFANILSNTLMDAGMSAGIGLGMGTAMEGVTHAYRGVRGSLRERALRNQLMASIPVESRHLFAGVPVVEVPRSHFEAWSGSSSGQAVAAITPEGPVIFLREGANPRVLREEGIHLMQSTEEGWAGRLAELSESKLAHWNELSLSERMHLYRTKLDVEINAHERLALDLGDELALAGPLTRRGARRRLAEVEASLDELRRKRLTVEAYTPEHIQHIADGGEGTPSFLDQPPRLFNKKAKPKPSEPAAEVALQRTEVPTDPSHSDYSPLCGRSDIKGTVVEIGPRWDEHGREYRLVGVLDEGGNITNVRQEIRSAREDKLWVQRGSESQKRGLVTEEASRRMSASEVRPGWDTKPIISQWDPSGRGFDEVLLDFRMEGGELIARVRVIEVKDYPGRYVPLESFTAIQGKNLQKNFDFIRNRLNMAGTKPRPEGLGLTREQVDAAITALNARRVDLEIRITPETNIGGRERGSVLAALEEEFKKFGNSTATVRAIEEAHLRAARLGSQEVELPGGTVEGAATRQTMRQRALRNEFLRSIPSGMRAEFAGVPIHEVSGAEFDALTRGETGQAVTLITPEGSIVVVRKGADAHVLREEGIHVLQSRERAWAARVAELSEANLSRWNEMTFTERLALYRTKLEVEIDAHRRLLADLNVELLGATGSTRRAVADQIAEAQQALANLTRLLEQAGAIKPQRLKRMAAGREGQPDYLQQPPRLFAKRRDVVLEQLQSQGLTRRQARGLLERIREFGAREVDARLAGEISARTERIQNLRELLDSVYHSVVREHRIPSGLTPDVISGLLQRFETEIHMTGIELKTDAPAVGPPGRSAAPPLAETIGGRTAEFDLLREGQRQVIARLAAEKPDMVRGAVEHPLAGGWPRTVRPERLVELEHWMRGRGYSKRDIRLAMEGLHDLNLAFGEEALRARPSGQTEGHDPDTVEGRMRRQAIERMQAKARRIEARQAADPGFTPTPEQANIVAAIQDPEFQGLLRTNLRVAQLAHETPQRLAELWSDYIVYRTARLAGGKKRLDFASYLHAREVTEYKGAMGEFDAAHLLGARDIGPVETGHLDPSDPRSRQGIDFLKPPDHNVTKPGTDLVGVSRENGDILQIDNKAHEVESLSDVKSLIEHYPKNLRDDAAEARRALSGLQSEGLPIPDHIRNAVDRLEAASREVDAWLAKHPRTNLTSLSAQREIEKILKRHRVRRVLTNAWGASTEISDWLRQAGIRLRNLNP